MQLHNLTITIIETEEDRNKYYLSTGFKPPCNTAMVKGCFNGEDCSTVLVQPKKAESYFGAIERTLQDELNDETLFVVGG